VVAQAYGADTPSRANVGASLRKVRNLLTELGRVTPLAQRLCETFGISTPVMRDD